MGRMKQGLLSPQHAHIRLFPNMLDLGAFSDTVNHPCQQQRLLCNVGPMRRLVLYLPTLTYFPGEMNKWVTLLNPNSLTDRITKPSFSGISCLLYCYCASNKILLGVLYPFLYTGVNNIIRSTTSNTGYWQSWNEPSSQIESCKPYKM